MVHSKFSKHDYCNSHLHSSLTMITSQAPSITHEVERFPSKGTTRRMQNALFLQRGLVGFSGVEMVGGFAVLRLKPPPRLLGSDRPRKPRSALRQGLGEALGVALQGVLQLQEAFPLLLHGRDIKRN